MRPGLLAVVASLCLAPWSVACLRTAGAEPPPAANTAAKVATVVLVANMGEADESCGCGEMIRAVRSAATKGVKTHEVDSRNAPDLAAATKAYRILVQPSVVMVDGVGREVRRYEGESKETLNKLIADLELLAKK